MRDPIIEAIKPGSGHFQHGHTYICHPSAATTALAVQQVIQQHDLLTQVRQQGDYLLMQLQQKIGGLEFVGDTRDRGLFAGIELVQNKQIQHPFAAKLTVHKKINKPVLIGVYWSTQWGAPLMSVSEITSCSHLLVL